MSVDQPVSATNCRDEMQTNPPPSQSMRKEQPVSQAAQGANTGGEEKSVLPNRDEEVACMAIWGFGGKEREERLSFGGVKQGLHFNSSLSPSVIQLYHASTLWVPGEGGGCRYSAIS